MRAKTQHIQPYIRPWISWGWAFSLASIGTASGLSCESPGLDLVTSGYSALACDLTKDDLTKITSNKQNTQLLDHTKILLDQFSQNILLIIDLEKSPYPFKARQFNNIQWGFETSVLKDLSLLGFTYQRHLASVIKAKDRFKSNKIANTRTLIIFSKGISNKSIIFPSQKGVVLGDVYFAEGAISNKIGTALPDKFVFNDKLNRVLDNGQSFLTQAGRAAQFLGLSY